MHRTIALAGFAALIAAIASVALWRRPRMRRSAIFSPIPRRGRQATSRAAISSRRPRTTRKCRNCRRAACCRPALQPGVARRARCSRSRWRRRPAPPWFRRTRRLGSRSRRRSPVSNAALPPGANRCPAAAGPAPAAGTPQTPASLQPGDEIVHGAAAAKIINKKASFSGLDKITGRIINFERTSARPCNSARCGSRPTPATPVRRPKPPTPTPSSRSTRSRCRAK